MGRKRLDMVHRRDKQFGPIERWYAPRKTAGPASLDPGPPYSPVRNNFGVRSEAEADDRMYRLRLLHGPGKLG